jgi:hypothetical protein
MKPSAHRPPNPRVLSSFGAALALLGAGCAALTSAGPVGPMRSGTTTQLSASWAYAYGPATATVGRFTVQGNAQMQSSGFGLELPSPAPLTVGFRQAAGDMVELSGEAGEMDSGLRLRVGMSDGSRVPWDLSFEARTGEVSFVPVGSYQGSAAVEIYPDITPPNTYPHTRAILSLGIAGGVFKHQMDLPAAFNVDNDIGYAWMTVLRPEVRVQTAFGVYLGGGKNEGTSIVVAPWFLLSAGTPTATCGGCGLTNSGSATFSLTAYSQSWGLALIITPSYSWLHGS